ncbi:transcriptional regulator [Ktedonosporobacter rubrisoli]|uniref:Transcriptional regulator n=1 Tax=Ktedonosporobacter rubrisoli TaxID=2509675 RepID=A0A4P6JZ45_KTERU|nr:LuxR C-terminal-related transcriptional regulator [Ktedonosporobacter rubrisoli]QBD80356.1 transcriptional regulator [Ktedonosporobacter rubrisoli]
MPKRVPPSLVWSEEHRAYILREPGYQNQHLGPEEADSWLQWLDSHTSVSFQGQQGHLNLLREKRARGGAGYWYAYRYQGKRAMKKYAGRTADLHISHLEALAAQLSQLISQEKKQADKQPRAELSLPVPYTEAVSAVSREQGAESLKKSESSSLLLVSKLSPPRLPSSLLIRERLLSQLDDGIKHKLTLLAAPAGFGKTTLVGQWIAERGKQERLAPLAWVSLDPEDNDPVRFWRYVITACQNFRSELGLSALSLLQTTLQPPFEVSPLEAALTDVLQQANQLGCRGILVLEDYHVITAPQIHESLTFLIDHLPEQLHVIILTRSEPPLPLARWRSQGDFMELHVIDLRFSQGETHRFLQQRITSKQLSSDVLAHLETLLEGWVAGLHLIALALQGRMAGQEIEQYLATFDGSHRHILTYFVTEVLSALPESQQIFLLQTSILRRLNGSLCDAATDRHNSAQLLEALARSGLFLEPLDEPGQWYRYHAIWASAMQHEARRRLGEHPLRELAKRASLWYAEQGMLAEAIEVSLAAGVFAQASIFIEQLLAIHDLFEYAEQHTLRRWLEQLPENILSTHPQLCFAYAIVLLFGTTPHASIVNNQFEQPLRMAEQAWEGQNDRLHLGELQAFRALASWIQGDFQQTFVSARQALAYLPEQDSHWRSISLLYAGTEKLYAGCPRQAMQILQEAYRSSENIKNRYGLRIALLLQGTAAYRQGHLQQAAGFYQQALGELAEDPHGRGQALLGLAQLSYERNELETAHLEAQEALDLGQQQSDDILQIQASLILVRILHARGQSLHAQQRLATLLPRVQSPRSRLFASQIQAMQAQLGLAIGDFISVQRWVTNRARYSEELPRFQLEQDELLMVRWHLARGETETALSILQRWQSDAKEQGRTHSLIQIQVLMALALNASRRDEARQQLLSTLTLASTEGYMRTFLDEGDALSTLLRTLVPRVRNRALTSYLQTILHAVVPQTASLSLVQVQLSPQELRVLRLLAAGCSNPEIARELNVSVTTIRTQVQSIYHKLNVNNRVAASEAAHHLHLL